MIFFKICLTLKKSPDTPLKPMVLFRKSTNVSAKDCHPLTWVTFCEQFWSKQFVLAQLFNLQKCCLCPKRTRLANSEYSKWASDELLVGNFCSNNCSNQCSNFHSFELSCLPLSTWGLLPARNLIVFGLPWEATNKQTNKQTKTRKALLAKGT